MKNIEKIKWHPAFYAGMQFALRRYKEDLIYESEHRLSKEPIRMDFLIVKKKSDVVVDTSFGRIFRKYNIIEYKSPEDGLTIDDFFKTIGYASLYKGYGETVNQIPADELTVSFFRHRHPKKLFRQLTEMGCKVWNADCGVYYVNGFFDIPVQVVVTKEIDEKHNEALCVLTPSVDEDLVRRFVADTYTTKDPGDKSNADAVLQASVSANQEMYKRIRRDDLMCEALRELFKDEIEAAENKGREQGIEQGREEMKSELKTKDAIIKKLEEEIAKLKSGAAML